MEAKHPKQISEKSIRRWNNRIPKALEVEDAALPKKLRKPRYSPFDALENIYHLLDRYYGFTDGLTPCAKGCAYCCHSEVAVSQIEADFIAAKAGISRASPTNIIKRRSVNYCDPERPCPFLSADGACAVYPYRPMLCRTHVSFDSSNTACQFDSGEESVFFIDRAKSFPGAMTAFLELTERHCHGGGGFADIREYFGSGTRALPIGLGSLTQPRSST